MKIRILASILMVLFSLGGISNVAAVSTSHENINVVKDQPFTLFCYTIHVLYEWIDDDGYNHDILSLIKTERSKSGTPGMIYTFKAKKTGTTEITIKKRMTGVISKRTVTVHIS